MQALEIDLGQWYDRLPDYYRVDPQPLSPPPTFVQSPYQYTRHHRRHNQHSASASGSTTTGEYPHSPMSADDLRAQSALLLMLQYQTQWIILHKTFFNNANSRRCSPQTTVPAAFTPTDSSPLSSSSPIMIPTTSSTTLASSPPCPNKWNTTGTPFQWQRQCTDRSQAICLDAADRIVVISEAITEQFGWCVCQQFISCIYQASTVFCRNAIANNQSITPERQHANAMIQRIVRVLAASTINYEGLPDDMTKSLIELLNTHSALPKSSIPTTHTAEAVTTDDIEMAAQHFMAAHTLSHHDMDTSSEDDGHGNNGNNNFDFIPTWNDDADLSKQEDGNGDGNSSPSCLFAANAKTIYMPSSPTMSTPSPPPPLPVGSSSSPDFSTPESISLELPAGLKHPSRFPMTVDSPPLPTTLHQFNDALPNSPHMYRQCLTQPRIRSTRHRSLMADQSPTEAMLSIKMKDPVVDDAMAMEKANESSSSWRHKFSSPSVAIGNQRII